MGVVDGNSVQVETRAKYVTLVDTGYVYVTMLYHEQDPYAVHFHFHENDGSDRVTVWTFARTLLEAGLDGPEGLGDVSVWPTASRKVAIRLSSPSGTALFLFNRRSIGSFLAKSYELVNSGCEEIDVDNLVTQFYSKET